MATESARRALLAIDLVLFSASDGELRVLLQRVADGRLGERWMLPSDAPRENETLQQAAQRLARSAHRIGPPWMEQLGAFRAAGAAKKTQKAELNVAVAFVGVVPPGVALPADDSARWAPLSMLPELVPLQRELVERGKHALRERMDAQPIAFRLLPATFTLSELQEMYELLLGRSLHKASFRRALQAAWLVEPADEWRSEGRGRPAQLFRYSPRRRRSFRRSVRFDLLG